MKISLKFCYKPNIRTFHDITPESILSMLADIQRKFRLFGINGEYPNLQEVLYLVESGEYDSNKGIVTVRFDLSSARSVVRIYRKYSEGGCKSCVRLEKGTRDSNGRAGVSYCRFSEQDYGKSPGNNGQETKYEGPSPNVKAHYRRPCEAWVPRFHLTLEDVVSLREIYV
jgi:hypothetical protein